MSEAASEMLQKMMGQSSHTQNQSQVQPEVETRQRSYNVDSMDTIPSHIFNYINHLYQKKQQDIPLTPSLPSLVRSRGVTLVAQSKSDVNIIITENIERQSSLDLNKNKQTRNSKEDLYPELLIYSNRYLKKVYRMGIQELTDQEKIETARREKELDEYSKRLHQDQQFFKTEDDRSNLSSHLNLNSQQNVNSQQNLNSHQSLEKILLTNHTTSQYFSNSMQKGTENLQTEINVSFSSDIDVDDVINLVNTTSLNIVDQLLQLKNQFQDDQSRISNPQFQLLLTNTSFEGRQQAFTIQKQKNLQQLQHDQQMKDNHFFTPKIQQNQKLVNSYLTRQFNSSSNGHKLKNTQKHSQTQEASYTNELLVKSKLIKTQYKKKIQEHHWDSQKRHHTATSPAQPINVQEQCVQTEWSVGDSPPPLSRGIEPDLYIPIQDRVAFILESRESKRQTQIQQKKINEESYYQSLSFVPNLSETLIISSQIHQNQEFQHNQLRWKKKLDERILNSKINENHHQKEEQFTYQPQILEKSKRIAEKMMDQTLKFTDRQQEKSLISEYNLQQKRQIQFAHHPNPEFKYTPRKGYNSSNEYNMGNHTENRNNKKNENKHRQMQFNEMNEQF